MVKHKQKVLESYLTGFITGSRVLTKSFVLVKYIRFSQDQFRGKYQKCTAKSCQTQKQAGAELGQAKISAIQICANYVNVGFGIIFLHLV